MTRFQGAHGRGVFRIDASDYYNISWVSQRPASEMNNLFLQSCLSAKGGGVRLHMIYVLSQHFSILSLRPN